MNHSNKDGKPYAESEEGRPLIKENTRQPNTYPTQSEKRVSLEGTCCETLQQDGGRRSQVSDHATLIGS